MNELILVVDTEILEIIEKQKRERKIYRISV